LYPLRYHHSYGSLVNMGESRIEVYARATKAEFTGVNYAPQGWNSKGGRQETGFIAAQSMVLNPSSRPVMW
jgi:hypothetical protein